MLFGNYNNMNMLGMNNMFGMNGMFNMNGMFGCGNNILGSLFSGTNSIFNNGFNMFGMNEMFNMNGMFGSSCSLFTKCNGQVNYGALAGFGVAGVLMNVGGAIVSNVIAERKANSPKAVETDINDIQDKIDTNLDKLSSDITEKNYKDYDVKTEDWYTEAKAKIDKNLLDETALKENQDLVTDYETKAKLYKETATTDPNYDQVKKDYEKALALKNDAGKKIEAHEKAIDELKKLDENAEKEQKNVNKIIETITDLIEKRNNAEAVLEDKLLSKAAGKEKKLISDDDYNNALKSHNDENTQNDVKFTKSHLQKAAAKYRKATTEEDKTKFKNEFNKIYTWLLENNSGEITDDLAAIADMIL